MRGGESEKTRGVGKKDRERRNTVGETEGAKGEREPAWGEEQRVTVTYSG